MNGCMEFDYYYGIEAEQFSFYRVPRILIKDERFKGLSSDAKLLYGLMLDRMSLSMKNGWLDGQNRAYIYYTLDNVMEDLGCCRDKCIKIFAELDVKKGIGLIEKKRQGLGKPDIIYVKNFSTIESEEERGITDTEICGIGAAGQKSCLVTDDIPYIENISGGNGSDQPDDACGTAVCKSRDVPAEGPVSKPDVICFNGAVMQAEESAGRNSCAQPHACLDAGSDDLKTSAAVWKRQTSRSRENGSAEVGKTDMQKSEKQTSGNLEYRLPGTGAGSGQELRGRICRSQKSGHAEIGKMNLQKSEKQTSGNRKNRPPEIEKTDLQKSEIQICRNRQDGFAEVLEPDCNYTEKNYIEKNYTENINIDGSHMDSSTEFCNINPINQSDLSRILSIHLSGTAPENGGKQENDREDGRQEAGSCIARIKKNIEYDHFMQYGNAADRELFQNLYEVICAVVCAECETVRISGASYPHEMVKERFLKLRKTHLEYVIFCFGKNTSLIYNINEYMKASLFNAVGTINGYYQLLVQHDLYGGGQDEKNIV